MHVMLLKLYTVYIWTHACNAIKVNLLVLLVLDQIHLYLQYTHKTLDVFAVSVTVLLLTA